MSFECHLVVKFSFDLVAIYKYIYFELGTYTNEGSKKCFSICRLVNVQRD